MVPSFTYSVCFGAIVKIASTHLDPALVIWVKGRKFLWEDFTARETGSIVLSMNFTMPSAMESMMVMVGDIVIYMTLAWYFDHIVSHNRGVADPPYFLFTKKYWRTWLKTDPNEGANKRAMRLSKKKKKDEKAKKVKNVMEEYDDGLHAPKDDNKKDSVKKEKQKVKSLEKDGELCEGLRIIGLKKTYFKKAFNRKSKDDVHAVRGVYLEVPDRELLCLLGHNGAGKSTLFSMLTGVL
jgi:ABC-type multidrug transport system fused ATPase/permease subunit